MSEPDFETIKYGLLQSVPLPKSMIRALEKLAAENRRSVTDEVQEAVKEYLSQRGLLGK